MEVPGIQTQGSLAAGGVTHIELVRADGITLRANAEQLALHGINMVRRVKLLANGFIQCSQQALARGEAVNGDVLHAVRDPDIHHRRGAKLFTKPG